jgi:hypothetical protein
MKKLIQCFIFWSHKTDSFSVSIDFQCHRNLPLKCRGLKILYSLFAHHELMARSFQL